MCLEFDMEGWELVDGKQDLQVDIVQLQGQGQSHKHITDDSACLDICNMMVLEHILCNLGAAADDSQ